MTVTEGIAAAPGLVPAVVDGLHDRPSPSTRLEQGDTGEGHTSRQTLADAVVAALTEPAALGTTFEIYDDPDAPAQTWPAVFASLHPETLDAR